MGDHLHGFPILCAVPQPILHLLWPSVLPEALLLASWVQNIPEALLQKNFALALGNGLFNQGCEDA